jgi:hypothetical protein
MPNFKSACVGSVASVGVRDWRVTVKGGSVSMNPNFGERPGAEGRITFVVRRGLSRPYPKVNMVWELVCKQPGIKMFGCPSLVTVGGGTGQVAR